MWDSISNWIFHRALRVSAASVVALAKKTGQKPERLVALNDVVAGIGAHAAVQAVQKQVVVMRLLDGQTGDISVHPAQTPDDPQI